MIGTENSANPLLRLNPKDNAAVALKDLLPGETIGLDNQCLKIAGAVPAGHKVAITKIKKFEPVIKYGCPIGNALQDINPGEWIHSHNLRTGLAGLVDYTYAPITDIEPVHDNGIKESSFQGYLRENGKVGIRNEVWVINTVGCINGIAEAIVHQAKSELNMDGIDGIFHYGHPYGCSQLGADLENTQLILANLVDHPNAGGVLVLGLGCENNHLAVFKPCLHPLNDKRVKFLNCQDVGNEIADGVKLIKDLVTYAQKAKRRTVPASELIVGLKCGGSDGFSGITANPLLGAYSDLLVAQGGTAIMTEVPEMFGAETTLLARAASKVVFDQMVDLFNAYKSYYQAHNQPIYENPSPGNKEGGITTLEEKSLGCVQKGGLSRVKDVLAYGGRVKTQGLNIIAAPGNDSVACTALAAAGAQLILFTTGRGTPFGSVVPTVKISTNKALFNKKSNWIDFDAGCLLEGIPMPKLTGDLFEYVMQVANGSVLTKNEINYCREMSIFKNGVTL
ncbi:D-altronate dehydratase [Desulfotomaculum arcticum]|uniref:D-altronate dehydratase n=1 Tax=Desulfotruncus arcticus DSM 17038 TaxID=1121424 RepID=A0A1I2YG17_9FIRM|nr:altronate dehydratase family protein [Desulfotruncus arcticus]SFH24594.1 D-altronate dehydratase [Desulfotomaculum arcticum] [Desulfotruncus arcticus DSM 17038]